MRSVEILRRRVDELQRARNDTGSLAIMYRVFVSVAAALAYDGPPMKAYLPNSAGDVVSPDDWPGWPEGKNDDDDRESQKEG